MPEDKKITAWIGIGLGILAAIGLASTFKPKKEAGATIKFMKVEEV